MSTQPRSLLFAAIVTILATSLAQCAQPALTIAASLLRDGVPAEDGARKTGSEIVVQVALVNYSDRAVSSPQWDYHDYYTIEVRDDQGNPAPESEYARRTRENLEACKQSGKTSCGMKLGHGLMSQIDPGKGWQERIVITKYYDMSRPGKYTIQLVRQLPEELGPGVVKSNTIAVTIVE